MSQNNPFADAYKAFANFESPAFDFKDAFNIGRRSVEVFTAANQAIAEGVQNVARRQAELAQKNAEGAVELFKEVYSSKNPEASLAKQADFAKKSLDSSVADARELLEMASASGSKACEIVSKHVIESAEQFGKKATKKAS